MIKKIISFILSLIISPFVWIFALLYAIPMFTIALIIKIITYPFDRRQVILHRLGAFWAGWTYIFINPYWHVSILGKENIKKGTTYVMVSNHQSLVDILVLYRLNVHFKWVAKSSLFKVPLFGWQMRLCRYIQLEREDMRSQFKMLKTAMKNIEERNPVMIFPEGTRTPDGNMQRFKDGAFVIAKKTGAPILPIMIHNSYDALPKKSFLMKQRTHIKVQVLPEISAETVAASDTKELRRLAQEAIQESLNNYLEQEKKALKK